MCFFLIIKRPNAASPAADGIGQAAGLGDSWEADVSRAKSKKEKKGITSWKIFKN